MMHMEGEIVRDLNRGRYVKVMRIRAHYTDRAGWRSRALLMDNDAVLQWSDVADIVGPFSTEKFEGQDHA